MTDAGGRAEPGHLVVGHVTKAHGTKGELFVWPLTDRPEVVFAPGRELLVGDEDGVVDDDAPLVAVESARPFKRGLLIKFEELKTREDADELAQRYLLLPADLLPPLEEGEFFYHQLLGMTVETVAGVQVGHVREVYETEPHHLLEVEGDGRRHLIPFAARIVREVDTGANRIVIDPPAGLLEL
ncbi:MAG TPA: ribosome maturation factor RimM [Longimicrobiales bacterium]